MTKTIINIVYTPQTDGPHKVYENDKGEIWHSATRDPNKINIAMGWYSSPTPKAADSFLVVEPYCILDRDYRVDFAKKFKYIFSWASKAFIHDLIKPKLVEIHHPTYHSYPNFETIQNDWPTWSERKKEIIFVANNKTSQHHSEIYSLRLLLADMLDAMLPDFNISWYGQIPIKRKYYKGTIDDKQSVLKQAQFSICTENSYDPIYTHNYLTEKMPDVWMSGAVPIYMGCYNIDDFGFPANSYIDLRSYARKEGPRWLVNKEALTERIKSFTETDYSSYKSNLQSGIFDNNKLVERTSYALAYDKIIDKFQTDS